MIYGSHSGRRPRFSVAKIAVQVLFRRGAAVAQRTVNPLVVGSNPTAGATCFRPGSNPGSPRLPPGRVPVLNWLPGYGIWFPIEPIHERACSPRQRLGGDPELAASEEPSAALPARPGTFPGS